MKSLCLLEVVDVRIDAKRKALDQLDAMHATEQAATTEEAAHESESLPVTACGTSQSTSHSVWLGSVARGKLLIPLNRRDVRVVEGARLESVCRGNSTEGSNPSLSASSQAIKYKGFISFTSFY